jgi:hypothetical protein
MGDPRRVRCQSCGGHVTEVGELSWTGKCQLCWQQAVFSNVAQMMDRRGPNFSRWRSSMAACVGGVLLDDLRERP